MPQNEREIERALRGERVEFPGRRGNMLVGDIHRVAQGRGPWLVLCHGMESTRQGTKQTAIVERFVADGLSVLRFDFSYLGESEGDFADLTVSGEVEDALGAIDFVYGFDPARCVLVGSSLGGMVALRAASLQQDRLAGVATIAAVADPSLFTRGMDESDLQRWRSRGYRDWGERVLRSSFLEDIERFDLLASLERLVLPLLVMHGDSDRVVPCSHATLIGEAAGGQVDLRIFPGVGHRFEEEGAVDAMLDALGMWLREKVGIGHA
ncbi:MAG: alpha/beta hydrolase [Candidatus Binatia bacterium]